MWDRRRQKRFLFLCLVAFGLGCAPRLEPELKVVVAALPTTLDQSISHASSWTNYPVMLATLKGLTALDERGRVVPGLAQSWEREKTSEGHERYLFHLRPDVRWSDGKTPLTAEDFVFAWRRALTGEERGELAEILGAPAVLEAQTNEASLKQMERAFQGLAVRAVDPHTLEVVLEKPRSYFLSRLANVYLFFPAPSAVLKRKSEQETRDYFDRPQNGHPLALGPWRLESWDRAGERLTLVRNPNSAFLPSLDPGEKPLERMTLLKSEVGNALFERNRVGFVAVDSATALAKLPSQSMKKAELCSTYFLALNTQRPPLDRVEVRRALAQALDREKLLRGLLPSARVSGRLVPEEVLPRGLLEVSPPPPSPFPGSRPLRLVFRAGDSFIPETAIAERIRAQLAQVGVEIELEPRSDFAEEVARIAPDGFPAPDLYLRRLGADYAHPNTFFTLFERAGNHHTGWENLEGGAAMKRFEHLLEEADAKEGGDALYREAESILVGEQAVVVPLFHPDRYFRVQPQFAGLSVDAFNFLSLAQARRREAP